MFSNLNAGFDHVRLPWRDGRRAAGDLVLENGYGIGPIRPETRVCCAVHTYAGRMSICMCCDRKYFGQENQRATVRRVSNAATRDHRDRDLRSYRDVRVSGNHR